MTPSISPLLDEGLVPVTAVGILICTMRLMDATHSRQVWRTEGGSALGKSRAVLVICDMQASQNTKANPLEVASTA